MNNEIKAIIVSALIFLGLGVYTAHKSLSDAPTKVESNIYSLESLNKVMDQLRPIQLDHQKVIDYLNGLKINETADLAIVQKMVSGHEVFLVNLPPSEDRETLERVISFTSGLKIKTDDDDRWAIGQILDKKNKALTVKLIFYLKTNHHHILLNTHKKISLASSNLNIVSDFPNDNEYFVPTNRVLKYSSQFLELYQDHALLQNRTVNFYRERKDEILLNSKLFLSIIFIHVLLAVFSYIRRIKIQKKLLRNGIINKNNPFYDDLMGLKQGLLKKDSEINILNEKVHRSQTYKRESETRVQVLEKYKKEIEIERNRFEKISLEKVNLLSFVGHDLRAPLSNILTTSRILEKKISIDQKAPLELIKKNAEDGLDLISGLLKSGGKKTGEENFQISLLIDEVISLCDNLSNKKNIVIVFNKVTESMIVHAQKLQIKQMLLNVLRNAIKYSPTKTTVTIDLKKHNVLPRNVIITITDQGPGIPKGELENIFKSYYRLSRDNQIEGSGVGLSFCRQICSQHGGAITADSDGKSGTRFEISLPIFISPEEIGNTGIMQLQQDASSQGINDNEIIIIEDSKATSEIMVQKLEKITKSIHVYPNGDQLLRKLKLFPEMLKLTKIIILDFEIPGTKGVNLINKLSLFIKDQKIPIVFFSGNVNAIGAAARLKSMEVFNKKTEFKKLYEYTESLFDGNKVKNILVIDDSEDIHYLLEVFFEDGPVLTNTVFCKSLSEGIKLIRENHHFWDIVFTDLNIGNERGEELLYVTGRENIKGKMKIIAMSAMIDETKRLELINLGFNDAVSKNFDQAIINSLIRY